MARRSNCVCVMFFVAFSASNGTKKWWSNTMDPIMVDFPGTPRSNSLKLIGITRVYVPRPSSQISNFSPHVWFWWLRGTNFTPDWKIQVHTLSYFKWVTFSKDLFQAIIERLPRVPSCHFASTNLHTLVCKAKSTMIFSGIFPVKTIVSLGIFN